MKLFFLYLLILVFKTTYSQKTDSIVDKRDGKTYKTVRIGNQIWMAENLAFKADSGCKEADPKNNSARVYGYIYHWRTARLACPEGWHLPYDDEWELLIAYLGGRDVAGAKLKSKNLWCPPTTENTNESGFSALPDGTGSLIVSPGFKWKSAGNTGTDFLALERGKFHSSVYAMAPDKPSTWDLSYSHSSISKNYHREQGCVRCLKNPTEADSVYATTPCALSYMHLSDIAYSNPYIKHLSIDASSCDSKEKYASLTTLYYLYLPHLKTLDLSGNSQLSYFTSMAQVPELEKLVLRRCGLKNLPEGLKELKKLKYLDLRDNAFSPEAMKKIRRLKRKLPQCVIVV